MHKFTQTGLAVQTIVFALLAGASALSHSGEYIVNAQEVKQAIARGAQVWDVRDEKQAIAGRIPGALNAGNPSAKLRDADKEDFVSTERIEAYFSNLGIKPGNEVVVYGARGAWVPYFSQYALNHHGVKTVRVFHDGIEEWTAAGEIVETGSLSPSKTSAFKSNIDPSLVIGTAELLTKRQNVQLVDVRMPKEFSGEDVRAIRAATSRAPSAFRTSKTGKTLPLPRRSPRATQPRQQAWRSSLGKIWPSSMRGWINQKKPSRTASPAPAPAKQPACCATWAPRRSRFTTVRGSGTP